MDGLGAQLGTGQKMQDGHGVGLHESLAHFSK